ncbi:MAG: accessory factor UbiK family protein [Pseudomonadota bacterium]
MTQTTNRFFDELARMMTDATGAAQGLRKEVDSVIRSQAEKVLNDLDVVQREEFDAMKAMAQKAREENARLETRIAELEEQLDKLGAKSPGNKKPKAAST